jgi:hypothetical protein
MTDAAEHKNDLTFNHGRRGKIKQSARRTARRQAKQAMRSVRHSD